MQFLEVLESGDAVLIVVTLTVLFLVFATFIAYSIALIWMLCIAVADQMRRPDPIPFAFELRMALIALVPGGPLIYYYLRRKRRLADSE